MRALLLATTLCLSCGPDFPRSIARLASPTILAVRAEPPESQPGAAVSYTALAATPDGPAADADIAWSFCATPAALTEDAPVSQTCVVGAVDAIARGPAVTLQTPSDACRRFGPLGMPAESGSAPRRPAAADATDGFYQPLRLGWADGTTIARERLTCDPTGISLELSQSYRATQRPNRNPALVSLTATVDGSPADVAALSPGAVIDLAASWAPESVESYVTVLPEQGELVEHRERLWVAWFATAGWLERDVSTAAPAATTATNRWHSPTVAGPLHLWVVLHDDRGGVDFSEIVAAVH